MTRPEWLVLTRDSELAQGTLEQSPRNVLPGCQLLALPWALFAPSEEARIDWLTTVDCDLASGEMLSRIPGPGIASPHPVRLWCTRSGRLVVTDGPIESAYRAEERLLCL